MKIRLVKSSDAPLLAEYHRLNADHFQPWEPLREENYYHVRALRKRLKQYEKAQRLGSALFFIALDDAESEVLAHCSLTNILYDPLRACFMGYGVSKAHEGQGIMLKLCAAAIDHAFNHLLLNRIMANYMPHNQRSAALLERLGFKIEGSAKRYLKINGKWEDHVTTSLLNPREL